MKWFMLFVATSGASLPAAAFQTKIFDCSSHILMTRTSSVRASSMAFQKPMQPIMYMKAASTTRFLVAGNAGEKDSKEVDIDALLKYTVSALVQMAAFAAILSAFDKGIEASGFQPPIWLSCIFFYACSLKSRILNPLSNERPMVGKPTGSIDLKRPEWFPPGVIFPIMWILIIGPIRAYSSAMVCVSTGEYLNMATLSFLLHLTVGDIWNTINNIEKRLGAAATGVVVVILSAANASYQYYQVNPTAGELLSYSALVVHGRCTSCQHLAAQS